MNTAEFVNTLSSNTLLHKNISNVQKRSDRALDVHTFPANRQIVPPQAYRVFRIPEVIFEIIINPL